MKWDTKLFSNILQIRMIANYTLQISSKGFEMISCENIA